MERVQTETTEHSKRLDAYRKARRWILDSLNFYRVHVIYFAVTPVIFAAIMWGSSTGGYNIPYIDCLFLCMSSMTVTGLATVNLSTLTPFQQVLMFILMIIGCPPVVSLITIIVRRHFFRSAFRHAIQERRKKQRRSSFNLPRTLTKAGGAPLTALRKKFSNLNQSQANGKVSESNENAIADDDEEETPTSSNIEMRDFDAAKSSPNGHREGGSHPPSMKHKFRLGKKKVHNISKGMIKRVEGGGVGLINPMGWYEASREESPSPAVPSDATRVGSEGQVDPEELSRKLNLTAEKDESPTAGPSRSSHSHDEEDEIEANGNHRGSTAFSIPRIITNEPYDGAITEEPMPMTEPSKQTSFDQEELSPHSQPLKQPYAGRLLSDEAFPRSRTIAFDDQDDGFDHDRTYTSARDSTGIGLQMNRTLTHRSGSGEPPAGYYPRTGTTGTLPRTATLRPVMSRKPDRRLSGFGGFPTPFEIARSVVEHVLPKTSRTLTQTMSMPRTATIGGRGTIDPTDLDSKEVPYISFSATVGRNSRFKDLTEEQMNELGGVEYRSLKVLLWIVVTYIIFFQLAAFVIIAPYIAAKGRYNYVFDEQPRHVEIPWFALWQAISAFTNTGMSLVDQSMIPFQKAYVMIVVIMILIFAGNTAFPIFLRITVWTIWKLAPTESRVKETLRFLLDHPRRCFIYLFPTTQTYVLLLCVLALTLTDWVSFLVLDIGTPAIEALPIGTRIAAGFLQSAAVRAAGFGIVPLSGLAPAVQVLYVIMMYISVYPIALSVRATNVYEERSLGLYGDDESAEFEDQQGEGAQAVAKYLGWHARRQLAFDIWWLGFALWLICIIERPAIDDPDNYSWFTIFRIIFELVSGYGTVGLSLGVPYDNYSFSGAFRKLSKLILVVVMLRGRHRGLPVAIDRAVMLPKDFTAAEEEALEEVRARRLSRRGSFGVPDEVIQNLRKGSQSNMSAATGSYRRPSSPTSYTNPTTPALETKFSLSAPPTSRQMHRRGGSTSSALSGSGFNAGSPLQFSLSRDSAPNLRATAMGPGESHRSGHLTPVAESALSRQPTPQDGTERVRSSL